MCMIFKYYLIFVSKLFMSSLCKRMFYFKYWSIVNTHVFDFTQLIIFAVILLAIPLDVHTKQLLILLNI